MSDAFSETGLAIRPMMLADVTDALGIERASGGIWTEGIFRDELRDTDTRVYVVATDKTDRVVGFCGLMVGFDEGHITNIAVDAAHRRHHIATRLLLHVTRIAIARSLTAMTLEVRVSNEAARKMYARFGYVPAGVRPRYYANNGEDALIFWANDIDTAAYGVRLASIAESLVPRIENASQS